ncbi:hypothetical protein JD292_08310 [Leucobacter sp. CSA2]|uniref:Secreted protein n=1 Tax=Leucobacter edaphi TaxID=2796472 RepID=A0A934UXW4_9MICO|nr:hypothetical protein [Leucobacter edaphi]MBK0422076.1 hypothetical protein [Leucobacter edaphi]
MSTRTIARTTVTVAAALAALLLSACSGAPEPPSAAEAPAAQPRPRLAVAHAGGIAVLEADTLELVKDLPVEGAARVDAAADGRHVFVRGAEGFSLLDTEGPKLSSVVIPAKKAGHVVVHGDLTAVYDDATAATRVLDTKAITRLGDGVRATQLEHQGAAPHHGVSVPLEDGTILTTVGTEQARTGVARFEPHEGHWHSLESNDACPAVHGEGVAAKEVAVFGCEDGVLLHSGDAFVKLPAEAPGGRTSAVFASAVSPIAVGSLTRDPKAKSIMIDALTLIDTAKQSQRTVPLAGTERVTFRGVARGEDGRAYLLSADGGLRELDLGAGTLGSAHPVIAPWEPPTKWEDAYPALIVHGGTAYVTEPASNSVHAIDLATGKQIASAKLSAAPTEFALVAGRD